MNKTGISWADLSSNPIRFKHNDTRQRVNWACVKASPGCANCYSEALNLNPYYRGSGMPFTVPNMSKLTPFLDDKELAKLLLLKGPCRVFVCDMTDIFGEFISDHLLHRLFGIMALNPGVTFQVLTKRAQRMRSYLCDPETPAAIYAEMRRIAGNRSWSAPQLPSWPLPNIWLGVSTENQEWAGRRIWDLLHTPAAVRWISAEPLLSSLDLDWLETSQTDGAPLHYSALTGAGLPDGAKLNWVVCGGESGPKARPFEIDWAFGLLAQCKQAGAAYFVKQLGSNPQRQGHKVKVTRKGTVMSEWPAALRVQEFPQ